MFREYGLPEVILTDNGLPFAGRGLRRLSRLSVWWIRLGIQPWLIRPGHPEENPRHERFHRTLKQATVVPPAGNQRAQQQRFDRFCREYNEQRPHHELGGRTPAELYRGSPRPFPRRLPRCEYPAHYEVRRVSSAGQIKLHNQVISLSTVLVGELVGWEEVEDGVWACYLGEVLLGLWDEREQEWHQ